MGLDAQLRTINTNTNGAKRHKSTHSLATFRKFYPLHMWVKDNIRNGTVHFTEGYPVLVEAELSANDIQRAYIDIANAMGVSTDIHETSSNTDLAGMRNAYQHAVKYGEDTPCVYYGGDC